MKHSSKEENKLAINNWMVKIVAGLVIPENALGADDYDIIKAFVAKMNRDRKNPLQIHEDGYVFGRDRGSLVVGYLVEEFHSTQGVNIGTLADNINNARENFTSDDLKALSHFLTEGLEIHGDINVNEVEDVIITVKE
jgi:hypothetical protein